MAMQCERCGQSLTLDHKAQTRVLRYSPDGRFCKRCYNLEKNIRPTIDPLGLLVFIGGVCICLVTYGSPSPLPFVFGLFHLFIGGLLLYSGLTP